MTGDRYRLVHVQNGQEHIESTPYGELEVAEQMQAEYEMHAAAGWRVEWAREHSVKFPSLLMVSPRGNVRRIYAKRFTAMQDSVAVRVTEPPLPPRTAHTGEGA